MCRAAAQVLYIVAISLAQIVSLYLQIVRREVNLQVMIIPAAAIQAACRLRRRMRQEQVLHHGRRYRGILRVCRNTGGLVLYCACSMNRQPACMLFANHIDSLAAAGAILSHVWLDGVSMPVVDCLGDEFLEYVKDGMMITVKEDGVVEVE